MVTMNNNTIEIDGKKHRVQKVPMSTGKNKFKSPASTRDNSVSVFDKFKDFNGGRHKSL